MTVLAGAEAPEAAAAAGTGLRRGGKRVSTRSRSSHREPIESERGGTRYVTVTETERGGRKRRTTTERIRQPGTTPGSSSDTTTSSTELEGKSLRQRAQSARKIDRGNYQGIILMEFVAAILLTSMTPIATKKDSQGLSPYAGSDIVKLSAITLVYLILAMISVGGRSWGRVAAWLGGLILLTDGLYEAANIAQDLQVFGGGGEPKKKAAA